MKYIILIYGSEAAWTSLTPEQAQDVYAAHMKYGHDMAAAGVLRGGAELKPSTMATTLRLRQGKLLTTDGPFAETKEQLGGYYIIEVDNLEKALHWAAQCPGVEHGSIEVRPLGAGA